MLKVSVIFNLSFKKKKSVRVLLSSSFLLFICLSEILQHLGKVCVCFELNSPQEGKTHHFGRTFFFFFVKTSALKHIQK